MRDAYRGWSHSSLRRARVGFRAGDPTFHRTPEHGPALVFLADPEIGWGLTPDRLAELVGEAETPRVWETVLEHDELLEVQGRATTRVPTGPGKYLPLRLTELREVLGLALRTSLVRRATSEQPWATCLRMGAETSWVGLAARLGPALPRWLDDARGGLQVLRVCEHTGSVFRATKKACFHPDLPKQAKRVQVVSTSQTAQGLRTPRVGSRFPPADPFAAYAIEVSAWKTCPACGEDFETAHGARRYCSDRCKARAARARRSHAVQG
jgi:hypothetical protein